MDTLYHLRSHLKLQRDTLDLGGATTGISTTGSVKLVTITNGGGGYTGTTESVGISTPKHVGAAQRLFLMSHHKAGLV